jgi:ascorbate-specific PTS system EIIC-type component UlaA
VSEVVGTVAAVLVGLVLLVAGASKLANLRKWASDAAGLGVRGPIAAIVPYVEIALAGVLISTLNRTVAAAAAALLFIVFTALLVVLLRRGQRPPCACFGALRASPIGWGHVARNTGFIALAIVAAVA